MRGMRPNPVNTPDGRVAVSAILAWTLMLGGLAGAAGAVEVTQVRWWTAPDHTRVVLDLSGPCRYDLRRVGGPPRIAINVPGARFRSTTTLGVRDGAVLRVRRNALPGKAQVVLDLDGDLRYRDFALQSLGDRPDRIVVDVFRKGKWPGGPVAATIPGHATEPPATDSGDGTVTVVIDPGHGGMDPGAVRYGVREKDAVLAVSRELKRLIDARPGYRAVLTRDGDYFVSLAERVRIARRSKGDLFVSVHANTHRSSRVAGMEVYFLSPKRATDREAQELADKENAADMVGLAPEERGDDDVLSILMDLRSHQVLSRSNRLADHFLEEARRSGAVTPRVVKQAGFQVLRSLAMPSVLVELAYLSHREDRELLSTHEGQRRLARILCDAILAYGGDQRLELAMDSSWATHYRVRHGDTLWELARRYRTSIGEIRDRNRLSTDRLRVGQTLMLP